MEPQAQSNGAASCRDQTRLLVVYAEADRGTELARALATLGYEVIASPLSIPLEGWVEQLRPHLILLLPLPERAALLEASEAVRKASDLPVILLSACDDELPILRALRLGIDDYLIEPIGEDELEARIDALLRRIFRYGDADGGRRASGLVLSPVDHSVELREKKVQLSPIEFRLLSCFVSAPGKVLTHQTLMARVWGAEYVDSRHYLRLYVRYLREKLEEDPRNPTMIVSEWGVGYRFAPPVTLALS